MIKHGVIHDIIISWLYMLKFLRFDWRDSYLLLRASPVNSLGWGCVWGSCMLGSSFGAELGLWCCSTCQPTAQEGSCGLLWSSHNQLSPNHSQQTIHSSSMRRKFQNFFVPIHLGRVSLQCRYYDQMSSQLTSLRVVYSIVYSGADQRKHQSSTSLAFVRGIHRDRRIPRTKGQLRGKCFHLMKSSCCAMLYWSVLWLDSATSQCVAVDTIKVFEFEFELYEAVCITSQWMGCMWLALCSALFWSVLILVDFTHIFQDYLTGPNSI